MAQKHKSKYKAPKDLEKSLKPKPRKDLKDYTHDDKKGGLNPKSTGEKQSNVLRKTDKEMVDDGKYDVKYNADHRLYKDLEDGEYDPKHAAKVFKKRQDKDEKDNEKNIQDKIENLTREGRERLVREYVRRKIEKLILEAEETDPTAEEVPTEEVPTEPPATDVPAAPTTPAATPVPTEPMAPDAAAPVPTETPAVETPATATPDPAAAETTPAAPEAQNPLDSFILDLQGKNNRKKLQTIARALNKLFPADADARIKNNFYLMLQQYSKRMLQQQPESEQ